MTEGADVPGGCEWTVTDEQMRTLPTATLIAWRTAAHVGAPE